MKTAMKRVCMAVVAAMLMAGFAACEPEKDAAPAGTENNGGGNGSDAPAGWVDLGLPSGLLWAECNLGATTPEGYGDYYAWGEVAPKSAYSVDNYRHANGGEDQLSKYCNDSDYGHNGFTDALTTLEAVDDAATQELGSVTRMPTKADWEELLNNTASTLTTLNNVNGMMFTSSNGNKLFLPAAGYRWDDELGYAGTHGGYWSKSLYTDDPSNAWDFYFHSDSQRMSHYHRYVGQSVRAVRSAR